jgi:hypothetical protein
MFSVLVLGAFNLVIENARTHTAQVVNINEFRLKPGGSCPVNFLNFTDEAGDVQTIQCNDDDGVSKGLKAIAEELKFSFPEKIKLNELRKHSIEHPAFSPT